MENSNGTSMADEESQRDQGSPTRGGGGEVVRSPDAAGASRNRDEVIVASTRNLARPKEISAPLPPLRTDKWPEWEVPAKAVEKPFTLEPNVFALPPEAKVHSRWTWISFVACVVLPLIIAAYYYAFVASSQYVSEFRFAVTDVKASPLPSPASGLSAMLGAGPSAEGMQNYIVVDYLTSQQAIEEILPRVNVVEIYSRPEVDWFSRFDRRRPKERFAEYWRSMVQAKYDPVSGLATAQVRAFTPQDSLRIAEALVALSEELVNKIALRSQQDAVRFAASEVTRAENRMKDVRAELTRYRTEEGVIDPLTNTVASNIQLANTLRAALSQLHAEYGALGIQQVNANAPPAVQLQARIKATKEELSKVEKEVANTREGNQALAAVVARYEKLDIERQYAQSMLLSTMQALDQARANAASQHLYLTPYVRPVLPESSVYPRRFFTVAMVGVVCFLGWLIGLFLLRTVREHAS
jgi:capsular polysaccharide transport system permease protein